MQRQRQVTQLVGEPQRYLDRIRQPDLLEHASLIGKHGGRSPTDHDRHVARTFKLSFDQLDTKVPEDGLALDLLARLACFAPGEPVPKDLLLSTLDAVPEEESTDADADADEDQSETLVVVDEASELLRQDALNRLVRVGLVTEPTPESTKLHRLVVRFVEAEADDLPAARQAVETRMLATAQQINQSGRPGPLIPLEPHLRHVAEQSAKAASRDAGTLFNELGSHLRQVARYQDALAAYKRALSIFEAALGPDHPTVAACVNNLGNVLQDLGDLDGTRAAYERALNIDEAVYGPNHPEVATNVNNLGNVLQDLGDLDGARAAYERALHIFEASLGPNHPSTLTVRQNLEALRPKQ